jgi:hypothetical protein
MKEGDGRRAVDSTLADVDSTEAHGDIVLVIKGRIFKRARTESSQYVNIGMRADIGLEALSSELAGDGGEW